MASSSRLPRGPHAERPRPDEKVRKRTGADLQNGWLARHGTLFLSDDRLVFVPTLMDTAMRAKRRGLYRETTWPQLVEEVTRIGLGLIALGVAPGDRVAHPRGCRFSFAFLPWEAPSPPGRSRRARASCSRRCSPCVPEMPGLRQI